jgi:hypothetical protein
MLSICVPGVVEAQDFDGLVFDSINGNIGQGQERDFPRSFLAPGPSVPVRG